MIARINGREITKQDLPVRLGEAMLCLGEEAHLGEAQLRLGGSKSSKTRPWVRLGEPTFA